MNDKLREDCAQLLAGIATTTTSLAAFIAGRTSVDDLPVCYFEVMHYLDRIEEFLEGPLALEATS